MKRRSYLCIVLLLLFSIFAAFPTSLFKANADMGPKPSVQIVFENLSDEVCYGTLLSKSKSTGPYSVWNGDGDELRNCTIDSPDVWRKFIEYRDEDGFYFLQWAEKIDGDSIAWTYYPPSTFKVLLYYPETNTFLISEIYERYAFDSYYTVDVEALVNGEMIARRSYDYGQEIFSLLVRIALTLLIELGLAWLMGFRQKKDFLLLTLVNGVTQIALNVYLNVVLYRSGALAFILAYVNLEFFVFLIEAILYCSLVRKLSTKPKKIWLYVVYALVANLASFTLGLAIAKYLPVIF